MIWGPEDKTESRFVETPSPRDNLVFEAGLCIGRLGRKRTFLLVPTLDEKALKIPSDVKQATFIVYGNENMADVGNRIRLLIEKEGPRTRLRQQLSRDDSLGR